MKFKFKDIDKKWKEYALAGCVCVLFLVCLMNLSSFFRLLSAFFKTISPVFIGFVIAYILNPLANFFQRTFFKAVRKDSVSWGLSVALALIIAVLIVALMLVLLIPQIADSVVSLAENYPSYAESLSGFLEGLSGRIGNPAILENAITLLSEEGGLITRLGLLIQDNAVAIIKQTTVVGTAAMNALIGFIFAIYFMSAKKSIQGTFSNAFSLMLSPMRYERLTILLSKFNAIFSKYIVCELLDSFIIGAINYIFTKAFSMPDALFISFVVGVTNLVPTFGPIIGALISVVILLLLKPAAILPFIIFTFVLQTLDGYVIKPKLFGNALDVPGVVILIAIIVFGKIAGVAGMLIAIPIAAIIVYIYSEIFIPWLELKRDLKEYHAEKEQQGEQ